MVGDFENFRNNSFSFFLFTYYLFLPLVNPFLQNSLFYGSFPKFRVEICDIFRLDKNLPMIYNISRGAYVGYTIYSAICCVCTQYIVYVSRM